MRNTYGILCLLGSALLGSQTALGGSTFHFLLDPAAQTASPSGSVSATLLLRETFDGTGSEVLDSTDGPGLFSFSVSISQGASTSGIPATISSATLNSEFFTSVSGVSLIGPTGAHTGVELHGAIGLPPSTPLTDGPATGAAGTLDVPIATLNLMASSAVGDTTDFVSSLHPMSLVFITLDETGTPISVTHGGVGQLTTVPEPAGSALLAAAVMGAGLLRRRRAN